MTHCFIPNLSNNDWTIRRRAGRLSKQPSVPVYYIRDWLILSPVNKWKNKYLLCLFYKWINNSLLCLLHLVNKEENKSLLFLLCLVNKWKNTSLLCLINEEIHLYFALLKNKRISLYFAYFVSLTNEKNNSLLLSTLPC